MLPYVFSKIPLLEKLSIYWPKDVKEKMLILKKNTNIIQDSKQNLNY